MNMRTALIGAALGVVAVVLLIVLSSGENDNDKPIVDENISGKTDGGKTSDGKAPAKPKAPTIVIGKDGKPVGGVADLTYQHGEEVRFKVKSAVADEIHVHGYDLMEDIEAGGTVSFDFPAEIEGVFEAELEGRGEQILELKVEP
jgi:hypothetical protein